MKSAGRGVSRMFPGTYTSAGGVAIGREIVRRMQLRGLSHRELSAAAQIGNSYILDLLSGRVKTPRVGYLAQISQVLQCTVDDLIDTSQLGLTRSRRQPILAIVESEQGAAEQTHELSVEELLLIDIWRALTTEAKVKLFRDAERERDLARRTEERQQLG